MPLGLLCPSLHRCHLAEGLFITAAPERSPTCSFCHPQLPTQAGLSPQAHPMAVPAPHAQGRVRSPQGPLALGLVLAAHTSGLLCPMPQPRMPLHSSGTVLTLHCPGSIPGGTVPPCISLEHLRLVALS